MITPETLIEAGFVKSEDPQFKFEYSLKFEDEDEEMKEGEAPALLFDTIMLQFCITDGALLFMYFNAETAKEAVEWASKITGFDIN